MADSVALLRHAATIRERCAAVTALVSAGQSRHFTLDRSQLSAVAERVSGLTRRRFPDLRIPYHSRWRHLEAGGVARQREIDRALVGRSAHDRARAHIDLVLASVLLDAGAGPAWHFDEAETGQRFNRSEGLAVASYRAFAAGAFSNHADDPMRVDAQALQRVDGALLGHWFQVRPDNPLVGLDGRAQLLRQLGQALATNPLFSTEPRPGRLFDLLTQNRSRLDSPIEAADLLRALLDHFSGIWPSGNTFEGVPVGDCWPHAAIGLVPFHKLSQWLAYSLIEPFEQAGVPVTGLDALTGLPEYRNGGLLLDAGVIVPRDARLAQRTLAPGDEPIVEWRALTVSLLDELAPLVREQLGAQTLPLACMLEGGTWAAGREIAQALRGGTPPLSIASDGTVF